MDISIFDPFLDIEIKIFIYLSGFILCTTCITGCSPISIIFLSNEDVSQIFLEAIFEVVGCLLILILGI